MECVFIPAWLLWCQIYSYIVHKFWSYELFGDHTPLSDLAQNSANFRLGLPWKRLIFYMMKRVNFTTTILFGCGDLSWSELKNYNRNVMFRRKNFFSASIIFCFVCFISPIFTNGLNQTHIWNACLFLVNMISNLLIYVHKLWCYEVFCDHTPFSELCQNCENFRLGLPWKRPIFYMIKRVNFTTTIFFEKLR